MPELPEVETVVRGLKSTLLNKTITSVQVVGHAVFRGKRVDFPKYVDGLTVTDISRHGKYILIDFSKDYFLQVHLGMTGRFLWLSTQAPLQKHTHFIFHLKDSQRHYRYADVRRFGWMEIVPKSKIKTWAPDAWKANEKVLISRMKEATGFMKNKLMDQNFIAGLGNIYVDECLYRAKIHPRARFEKLSNQKMVNLTRSIKAVLKKSIQLGGTSVFNYVDINGGKGGFKKRLNVYGKTGEKCVCGKKIKRIVVASRSTHFCPQCQRT